MDGSSCSRLHSRLVLLRLRANSAMFRSLLSCRAAALAASNGCNTSGSPPFLQQPGSHTVVSQVKKKADVPGNLGENFPFSSAGSSGTFCV
jgi:hypothetical protein